MHIDTGIDKSIRTSIIILLGIAALGGLVWCGNFFSQDTPYNVVFITIDTLRADHIGCYGYTSAGTPNIDSLAQKGVIFQKMYAQSPLTLPSHSTIMTGTSPLWHGVRDNSLYRLPQHIPTLATILQQYGYRTSAVVSGATLHRSKGLARGFQEYDDVSGEDGSLQHIAERRAEESVHLARQQLQRSIATQRPFFLWLHLFDPHAEYVPPSPYAEQYPHNPYQGEIAYTDACLSKLLNDVTQSSVKDHTIFVLTADHGEGLGEHGELSHGYFLYNSTLHVPCIFAGPNIQSNTIYPHICRSMDIFPTLLSLLQIKDMGQSQGTDLSKRFLNPQETNTTKHSDKENEIQESYAETYYNYHIFGWRVLRTLILGNYKYHDTKNGLLYDIYKDPNEKSNLLALNPESYIPIAKEFQQRLVSYKSHSKSSYSIETHEAMIQGLGYVSGYTPDFSKQEEALGYLTGELPNIGRKETVEDLPDPTEMGMVISWFTQAQTYISHNEPQQAARILEKILEIDPRNSISLALLGKCYIMLNNLESAQKSYEKVLSLRPGWMLAQKAILDVYIQRQNFTAAKALAVSILQTEGESDASVIARLAYIEIVAENFSEATILARKATVMAPKSASARFYLALSYNRQEDYAKAIPVWKEVLRLQDMWPEAYYEYGKALKKVGQPSRPVFMKALQQLSPNDPLYLKIQQELQNN